LTHKLIIPAPDTPPTQQLMSGGVGGATILMAAGAADLATSIAADCLTLLNLVLGLLELGFGAFLLWWVIRWWLARCESRTRYYEAELEHGLATAGEAGGHPHDHPTGGHHAGEGDRPAPAGHGGTTP
jgi:hypothetical protein